MTAQLAIEKSIGFHETAQSSSSSEVPGEITAALHEVQKQFTDIVEFLRADSHIAGMAGDISMEFEQAALTELAMGINETLKAKLKDMVKKACNLLKKVLIAGIRSATWKAAAFIPVIGPFTALAQSVLHLKDVTKTFVIDHFAYLRQKDPVLRTLFRMRDCMLQTFISSGATQLANDKSLPSLTRQQMLLEAIQSVTAAAEINKDLEQRLSKKLWPLEKEETREQNTMQRLITGRLPLSTTISGLVLRPDTEHDDQFLPPNELRPSAWRQSVGDHIDQTYQAVLAMGSDADILRRSLAVSDKVKPAAKKLLVPWFHRSGVP